MIQIPILSSPNSNIFAKEYYDEDYSQTVRTAHCLALLRIGYDPGLNSWRHEFACTSLNGSKMASSSMYVHAILSEEDVTGAKWKNDTVQLIFYLYQAPIQDGGGRQ